MNPLPPIGGLARAFRNCQVRDHGAAIRSFMADGADRFIQFLSLLTDRRSQMALNALILEYRLPIGKSSQPVLLALA
jgi:hypothetical protein